MKDRKTRLYSTSDIDSSEVSEVQNYSLYEFHRPHLILLSLYEESRIREVPEQEGKVLNSDSSGSGTQLLAWVLRSDESCCVCSSLLGYRVSSTIPTSHGCYELKDHRFKVPST